MLRDSPPAVSRRNFDYPHPAARPPRHLGIIKRVTGTYRYYLTRAGRAAIAAGRRLSEPLLFLHWPDKSAHTVQTLGS